MKRKTVVILFLLLSGFGMVLAQTPGPVLERVSPPSPNVQAMQKYGDIPVNPYTGVPTISVPLYTIKFRDISVPISLQYHASGIRVSEDASQTGLGWVLSAGGSISRKVIGDDDFDGNNYFDPTIPDFSNGQGPTISLQGGCTPQMFNRTNPNQPTIYNLDLTNSLTSTPAKDFQPDQFYYDFLGNNGKFIVKRTGEAVLQKQDKLQITFSTGGASWEIKSVDGYIYDFAKSETYNDNQTNRTVISAWYLTRITSPMGNQVTFNYTALPSRYIRSVGSYSETRDDYDSPGIFSNNTFSGSNSGYQFGPTQGSQYSLITLSSIDFTNGLVAFSYSDNRNDLPGDQRLDSVSVYAKDYAGNVASTPMKTVAMSYDYFTGAADPQFNTGYGNPSLRLKLLQVQEKGYFNGQINNIQPYVFTYYEGDVYSTLPAKTSFARDHWGYYNGKTGHSSLIPSVIPVNSPDVVTSSLGLPGPERDVDTSFIKAWSLKSIQYPTGGSTEFQYEPHDFDEQLSEVNDNSYFRKSYDVVLQSATGRYDAVAKQMVGSNLLDISNEYVTTANGGTTNVTISVAFRFSSGSCANISFPTDNLVYFNLYDSTGTNLLLHVDLADLAACSGSNTTACAFCNAPYPVFSYTKPLSLAPGKYVWSAYCGTTNYAANLQDISLSLNYYVLTSSQPAPSGPHTSTYSFAGGLRIKRIIDHDGINPANDNIKKFIYHYFADKINSGTPQEYSYGRRMARPQYAYFDVSTDTYIPDPQVFPPQVSSWTYNCFHLMRSSDSNIPLNGSAGGSVVGYDQVTELFGENGENGETVFQYINSPDIIQAYNIQGLPFRPPFGGNVAEPMNGSLLQQTEYSNVAGHFVPVKQVVNTYATSYANENVVFGIEKRPAIWKYFITPGNSSTTGPITPCDIYLYFFNSLKSEWTYLSGKDEKEYNLKDPTRYVESQTTYFYNNSNHLQPTSIVATNSKGENITTHITYPLDYNNLTATDAFTRGVQNLQSQHIINVPIEKYVQKSNADGTNARTVSAVITGFKSLLPVPDTAFQFQSASSEPNFTVSNITNTGLVKDPSYQGVISFDKFDAFGNILQQHKINDFYRSYIWDYNSSFPVAEVTNALASDIAYCSFEADGTGNWTLGSAQRVTTDAITGSNAYSLNSDISLSGINSATTYIVSYWTKNSNSFFIAGTQGPVRQGKTIKGWTYFEHTVSGQTSFTITGTGYIDELRLYPTNAQMTTYTYAPLVGMTSQCDVGNRVSYYEYDGLGRLRDIRDQDGNILKTIQYHYINQTGN